MFAQVRRVAKPQQDTDMTPDEQEQAIKSLNDAWFKKPMQPGTDGIAQVCEFLAEFMVEQERIIQESFESRIPVSFPAVFGALQYRTSCAIKRIDWHLSEATGEFHSSFANELFPISEKPQTVEEVQ